MSVNLNIIPPSPININIQETDTELTIGGGSPVQLTVYPTLVQNGTVGGVTSLTGTANEVEVDVSTGAVTVGLPSDVTIGTSLTCPDMNGKLSGQVVLDCKNTSGGTLTKGTPVYLTGSVGATNVVEVSAADAGNASKMPAVGVLLQDLTNNATGHIVLLGEIPDLNTNSWNVGDTLYVSTPSGLTNVKPTSISVQIQNIGKVCRKNASNGMIAVYGAGRPNDIPNSLSISDLKQSGFTPASNYQIIYWDGTAWKPSDFYSADNRVQFQSDMNTFGQFTAISAGTGASNSFTTAGLTDNGRYGFLYSGTGTTSTGYAGVGSATTDALALGTYQTEMTAVIEIPTLSDGTNRFQVEVGFSNSRSATLPTNAVMLQYRDDLNSGAWLITSYKGGVLGTTSSTGITVAANTWYKIRIVVDSSGLAYFYINGSLVGVSLASNNPAGTSEAVGFHTEIRKTVGTTARNLITDYMSFAINNPR
jgi:hypothetical protein